MSIPNENGSGVLATRVTRIEDKIDRAVAGAIETSGSVGGVAFRKMEDLMEFSKLMACSDVCVPKHLRGNPGACLAICMQAVEWRMSPYAVANKSYVVNDRISYESQLIHAVIEQRAPLLGRLRPTYAGEGPTRTCTITGRVKGEDEPFVYTSSPFGKIEPKNSPLWKTKPDMQLFYNASRDWARMYFPDLILGVYADDEIEVVPTIAQPAVSARMVEAKRAKEAAPANPQPVQSATVAETPAEVATPASDAPKPDAAMSPVEQARVVASESVDARAAGMGLVEEPGRADKLAKLHFKDKPLPSVGAMGWADFKNAVMRGDYDDAM